MDLLNSCPGVLSEGEIKVFELNILDVYDFKASVVIIRLACAVCK